MGASVLRAIFTGDDVAKFYAIFAHTLKHILNVLVDEYRGIRSITCIGECNRESLLGELAFCKATPYEVVRPVFMALPAGATPHVKAIWEGYGSKAHCFFQLSQWGVTNCIHEQESVAGASILMRVAEDRRTTVKPERL